MTSLAICSKSQCLKGKLHVEDGSLHKVNIAYPVSSIG